jgi:dihydroflavonol-4-reductase
MTTLVTGATGFIGRHLVERLRAGGCSVRALVRPGSAASALHDMGVRICPGDLRDPASVERAVSGCRQVFHLAAVIHGPGATRSRLRQVNVEGTENVARCCRKAGVERLVVTSSVAVYGRGQRNRAIDERTPPAPTPPTAPPSSRPSSGCTSSPGTRVCRW